MRRRSLVNINEFVEVTLYVCNYTSGAYGRLALADNSLKSNKAVNELEKAHTLKMIGTGLPQLDDGVYSIYASTAWEWWGLSISGVNTLDITTFITDFSTRNRVFILALNSVIEKASEFEPSMVVKSSPVETSKATEAYTDYSFTTTSDTKYVVIVQYRTCGTPPMVKGHAISTNYEVTYEDIKDIASRQSVTITDGKLTAPSASAYITFALYKSDNEDYPLKIKVKSSYTNSNPVVRFVLNNRNRTIRYDLAKKNGFDYTEYRIPSLGSIGAERCDITIAMPADSEIEYIEFVHEKWNGQKCVSNGINLNSHLGFYAYAPENTMPAFLASVQNGYDAIICNPKLTSDGVWVCCHDASINRTARNADGTAISSTVNVSDSTYNELLEYDFGIATNNVFVGTKIPKLEEFLNLCAVKGLRPLFSMHWNYTDSEWTSLKKMVQKYGLLKDLTVKATSIEILESCYAVMGDIWMYDLVGNIGSSTIASLKASSFYGHTPCMVDVPIQSLSQSLVNDAIDNDIAVGAFELSSTELKKYREVATWGVTAFTDDIYCFNGLKWL